MGSINKAKRSSNTQHPCLIPLSRVNELVKSSLILILAVGLLYSAANVSIIVVWKPDFESTLYKNDHLTDSNAISASERHQSGCHCLSVVGNIVIYSIFGSTVGFSPDRFRSRLLQSLFCFFIS